MVHDPGMPNLQQGMRGVLQSRPSCPAYPLKAPMRAVVQSNSCTPLIPDHIFNLNLNPIPQYALPSNMDPSLQNNPLPPSPYSIQSLQNNPFPPSPYLDQSLQNNSFPPSPYSIQSLQNNPLPPNPYLDQSLQNKASPPRNPKGNGPFPSRRHSPGDFGSPHSPTTSDRRSRESEWERHFEEISAAQAIADFSVTPYKINYDQGLVRHETSSTNDLSRSPESRASPTFPGSDDESKPVCPQGYVWQWQTPGPARIFVDFTPRATRQLEAAFQRDQETCAVSISNEQALVTLTPHHFTMRYKTVNHVVRRGLPEIKPPRDTVWKFLNENRIWEDCKFGLSNMEAAYQRRITIQLSYCDNDYEYNLTDPQNMYQKNLGTGTIRLLKRDVRGPGMEAVIQTPQPSHWELGSIDPVGCRFYNLAPGSAEYQDIVRQFNRTLNNQVVEIKVVQNPEKWDRYCVRRAHMHQYLLRRGFEKGANEMRLFHGTAQSFVEDIALIGFLRDYNRNDLYGRGIYFARDAKEAANYSRRNAAGVSCMFYSRVLVGQSCQGKRQMEKPERKLDGKFYESLTNDPTNPSIFVLAADSDSQSYTDFVIYFSCIQKK